MKPSPQHIELTWKFGLSLRMPADHHRVPACITRALIAGTVVTALCVLAPVIVCRLLGP